MGDIEEKGPDTRERLLHAAGEVFARSGFRSATVREISRCANANLAAVNYHFGDKKGLYATVLKYSHNSAVKKYPPDAGLGTNPTAEERLAAFVRSFLFRILDEGRPAWHGKLMAREVVEPTSALDQVVGEVIRPLYEYLLSIVRELVGSPGNDVLIHDCTMSVIGQCLHYYYSRSIILRLHSQQFSPEKVDQLARHITRFSLGAIRELSREGKSP